MSKPSRFRRFRILCTCAIVFLLNQTAGFAVTTGGDHFDVREQGKTADDNNSCVLTEAKGVVEKREHPDWAGSPSSNFVPVSRGERLNEGWQVATGDRSYAQLTWPDVTHRAWANSIYSLAPNHRIVYLQSGQMLFALDKHRKDKREYVLWTNLLQARVRGTTVFAQSNGKHSQITVLEGYIDVLNRKDKSVVRVYPGAVYDIQETDGATSQGLAPVTTGQGVQLFKTTNTVVSVFAPNTNALYQQPMVTGFQSPLPSLPLIKSQLASLPNVLTTPGAAVSTITSALGKLAQIIRVPTGVDYLIGQQVGTIFKLPADAISYFPPVGMIDGGSAQLPDGIAGAAGVNSLAAGILSRVNGTAIMGTTLGGAGVGGTAIGATTSVNLTGVAGSVISNSGGVIGGAVGTGGVLSGASSLLGGTTNTVTGTLSGATGTLGGSVSGTLGGATGTLGGVTGTLGGLTGGITGGLLH